MLRVVKQGYVVLPSRGTVSSSYSFISKSEHEKSVGSPRDVLRVVIDLDPTLIGSIHRLSSDGKNALQHDFNILELISPSVQSIPYKAASLYIEALPCLYCWYEERIHLSLPRSSRRPEMTNGIRTLLRGFTKTTSSAVQKIVLNRISSILPRDTSFFACLQRVLLPPILVLVHKS